MLNGGSGLFAYVNGLFAGMGTCTLPVLSLLAAQRGRVRFVLQFFVAQFILFSALNLAYATMYTVLEAIQPLLLLFTSILTFLIAFFLYRGISFNVPGAGGLYGVAFSPCSVGFAVAAVGASVDVFSAIANAFLFALGIATPLFVVAFVLRSSDVVLRHGHRIERAAIALLVIVSYYLAYLAGASWRWIP